MSNPWFRFYSAAMRNPKVAALSDRDFRLWMNLLAASSENDGVLPPVAELKHLLNTRLDHLLSGLDRLITAGLIDPLERGYTPHNWGKFQYKSDSSTARVQKHRQKGNVSVTAPDTETDAEKKEPIARQPMPREPSLLDRLHSVLGARGDRPELHPGLLKIGPVFDLVQQGYSLDDDILPVVRDLVAANVSFQSWAYVVPIVIERTAKRKAIPRREPTPPENWPARLAAFRSDGTWGAAWGPKPGEPGCKVPPELMKAAA